MFAISLNSICKFISTQITSKIEKKNVDLLKTDFNTKWLIDRQTKGVKQDPSII